MEIYPEINELRSHFENHQIKISNEIEGIRNDLFFVEVVIDGFKFKTLIDDEFGDFAKHNLLFKWFLVLNSIEVYKESEDILEWSREINVSAESYLDYYKSFNMVYNRVKELMGKVDSCISNFDYTLRTGVIRALENCNDIN